MALRKDELEGTLAQVAILKTGVLRDENPLDSSPEFHDFLAACRHGDLKTCQELIGRGVNINGKDRFDYTPLIIASLCGHYELVQLLLEAGALAERNTFQGERCIYNALNDRIRNLLLQYDFSKSTDPYVYWTTHISTLLGRATPRTADISLVAGDRSFQLHKFFLASRSPYFHRKLTEAPATESMKLAAAVPPEAYQIVLRYLYLGELPRDLAPPGSSASDEDIAKGLDKISKQLEVEQLWESILAGPDRRLARQRFQDEVERARKQVEAFFHNEVVGHKMVVDTDRVKDVKWNHGNAIFADVLLRADEPSEPEHESDPAAAASESQIRSIPIGPAGDPEEPAKRKSVLYPAHKAMLIRSEYFEKMFSGDFVESQQTDHLRVVTVDCTPAVLEIILTFMYTETIVCPLEHALDLLYAADMLFLDTLKSKAAVAISTLGSATSNALVDRTHGQQDDPSDENAADGKQDKTEEVEMEPINIYDVIHAAWELRVQRLEEFAARYLAYRLEDYIDEPDFQDIINESAHRLKSREETDTIELLDDIRYYLSDRFRLRFEDVGLEEMIDEAGEINAEMAASIADQAAMMENGAHDAGLTSNGDTNGVAAPNEAPESQTAGMVRTLDGEAAEDEFESDAINYQILLGKIDAMLDRLKLDA